METFVAPSSSFIRVASVARLLITWRSLATTAWALTAFRMPCCRWVLEMWGWALAAARLHIKHTIEPTFQAEPGGVGINDLNRYFIYHYTFDPEVGRWKWSKRHYFQRYPPLITAPPTTTRESIKAFVSMMNEAMQNVQGWGATPEPPRRERNVAPTKKKT
eukprot:1800014-Pleurochrysis_carterae.AAC.2